MLDIRAVLARGDVQRRVVSPQPRMDVLGRSAIKRKRSEDALLRQLPDKRSRKLMQRAERRAQQAVQPAQPLKKGRHALRRMRAAVASVPSASRSPTEQPQRGHTNGHAAGSAAGTNAGHRQRRSPGKQKGKQDKSTRLRRKKAKAAGRGQLGAGKQHSGWGAD